MSKAQLRTCARCEWIFKDPENRGCPKCGFGHYSALYVYGNKCYRYAKSQKPWFDGRMRKHAMFLWKEIREATTKKAEESK